MGATITPLDLGITQDRQKGALVWPHKQGLRGAHSPPHSYATSTAGSRSFAFTSSVISDYSL